MQVSRLFLLFLLGSTLAGCDNWEDQGFVTPEEAAVYRAKGYTSFSAYLQSTGFESREDAMLFTNSGYDSVDIALARGGFESAEETRQLILNGYLTWDDYEESLFDEQMLLQANKSEDWERMVELGDEMRDITLKDSAYSYARMINEMRIQDARNIVLNSQACTQGGDCDHSLLLETECENIYRISARFETRLFKDGVESQMDNYCGGWKPSNDLYEQVLIENSAEEETETSTSSYSATSTANGEIQATIGDEQERQTALRAERAELLAGLVRSNTESANATTVELKWFCSAFLVRLSGIFDQDYSLLGSDLISEVEAAGKMMTINAALNSALDGESDAVVFGHAYANIIVKDKTMADIFDSMTDVNSLMLQTISSCVDL